MTEQPPHHPALQRNDRYLTEVVEGHHLCPFAKPCRVAGQLHRVVVPGTAPEADLQAALLALHLRPDSDFEVALLIAPDYSGSPQAWEQLCAATQAAVARQLTDLQRESTCFAVAFHPQLPWGTATPQQLVGLFRHSPDPTWQVVRRSVIERVRGTAGEQRFVDPDAFPNLEALLAAAEALTAQTPIADRIAEANAQTWRRLNGELERQLTAIIEDQEDY